MQKPTTAEELTIANNKLLLQNQEIEKRAAELVVANIELEFQNKEKSKRAAELLISIQELAYQNREKEQRTAELIVANNELILQNKQKEERKEELKNAYFQLKKADSYLKEYAKGLEDMMYITSHKVRQPVANILGISSILHNYLQSPVQLKKLMGFLTESAVKLDIFTKELTTFIHELEQKGKLNQDDPVNTGRAPRNNTL
jgi:signal transduction histidine kinase